MEIGPFECKGVIISEKSKELVEALLENKLRCASCGNNKFVVEALVEARFVVVGGEVPVVCSGEGDKINITNIIKCAKETCSTTTFIKSDV